MLRVSSEVPNTSKQLKALGLRPRAFISFSVFGTPDETLALVFDILLQKCLDVTSPAIAKYAIVGHFAPLSISLYAMLIKYT